MPRHRVLSSCKDLFGSGRWLAFLLQAYGTRGYDGGNGVFVDHLRYRGIAQQHHVLIKKTPPDLAI